MISIVTYLFCGFLCFLTGSVYMVDKSLVKLVQTFPDPSLPLYIGDKFIMNCKLDDSLKPKEFSTVFKRDSGIIAERCISFFKDENSIRCLPESNKESNEFEFTIHKLKWTDRGSWACVFAYNSATINIKINQRPVMNLTHVRVMSSSSVDSNSPMPSLAASTSNDYVVGINSRSRSSQLELRGVGTSTNPYDLREGLVVDIICQTQCSYPSAILEWTYENRSISKTSLTPTSPDIVSNKTCNVADNTRNMTTTTSTARMDCTEMGLVGLYMVRCYSARESNSVFTEVYLLCPGGQRPMRLTSGEVVGIAVGCAIGLIICFAFCIMYRRNSKDPEAEHRRGIRV